MTSRQARRERREAERKAKKAERKRLQAAGLHTHVHEQRPPLSHPELPTTAPEREPTQEQEFSPEFIARARARAIRERISRRAGLESGPGFVSQKRLDEPALLSEAKTQGDRRAERNRRNALHSTGPRTSDGKLASSRNSLKHGLASGVVIIPGEDPAAFEALLNNLLEEYQPANYTEDLLIRQMAQSWWLEQRAIRLQNECFTDEGVDAHHLSLFLRYQTTHNRAFHKALGTLLRLQKERRLDEAALFSKPKTQDPETGFVSQKSSQPAGTHPALAAAASAPPRPVGASQ